MTEIRAGTSLVTLVNEFTPKPGQLDAFVAAQAAEYERLAGKVPGSLTVALHRARDGSTAVNYAQFESVEKYELWQASDLFNDHFNRIKDYVEHADPHLYEVVYTNDTSPHGVTRIDRTAAVATVINAITTPPDRQRELLDFVIANDAVFAAAPGFRSSNFHRALDGTRVVNYSQWDSEDAFLAAFAAAVGRPVSDVATANAAARQAAAGRGEADFRFFDVVYTRDERGGR